MSKNGHRNRLSDIAKNVCQWHRNRAITAWKKGQWDVYARHIRIADRITRKG